MTKRLYIETYGCQMNVSDSEVVCSILADEGYVRTENILEADVILVNTCSVRDNAEQRIWGRIDQFHQRKKSREGVLVGVLGCMAERLGEKLLATGKVDLVVGPDAYRALPALLEGAARGNPGIDVTLSRNETYSEIIPIRDCAGGISAFIPIMRGCNNVCSYCVVPYTRGVERSRDPHSIIREACNLFERGYREVTLLGQNVDSYLWKSGGDEVGFASLLEMVSQVSPELRVRFSTSNPQDISDDVLYAMTRHDNICRHIHLPVQSGSNRILEKMRRRYTREWYLDKVASIRRIVPDCGLTTDVIAGFCSETEEDHALTLSLFEQVVFDSAFMFYYSERPGTMAARRFRDDVPLDVKTRRLNEIIALQNRMSLKSYSADIGRTLRVLVEGPSKKSAEDLCGRASNNKMCVFPDTVHKAGDYVDVEVVGCTSATLLCKLK